MAEAFGVDGLGELPEDVRALEVLVVVKGISLTEPDDMPRLFMRHSGLSLHEAVGMLSCVLADAKQQYVEAVRDDEDD